MRGMMLSYSVEKCWLETDGHSVGGLWIAVGAACRGWQRERGEDSLTHTICFGDGWCRSTEMGVIRNEKSNFKQT